jgi:hypothetical protein
MAALTHPQKTATTKTKKPTGEKKPKAVTKKAAPKAKTGTAKTSSVSYSEIALWSV